MSKKNVEKVEDKVEEKVDEWDKKAIEFSKEVSEILLKYKEWCVLVPVNAINDEWEVQPTIKVKRLK